MAKLTQEEVLKIAQLARLELSEAEIAFYQERLSRVLEFFEELATLQCSEGQWAESAPLDSIGLRDDEPKTFVERTALLENAPALENECFLLPPVLTDSK